MTDDLELYADMRDATVHCPHCSTHIEEIWARFERNEWRYDVWPVVDAETGAVEVGADLNYDRKMAEAGYEPQTLMSYADMAKVTEYRAQPCGHRIGGFEWVRDAEGVVVWTVHP